MDPKYLVAKLDADKAAVEMALWRELQNDRLGTSPWVIVIMVAITIGFIVLDPVPRSPFEWIMLYIVMFYGAHLTAVQKRLMVITKLMKMHLMNQGQ